MSLLESHCLAILDSAVRSEFGLVVRAQLIIGDGQSGPLATPAAKAKQVLYRFRTDYADYRELQIRLSPTDPTNELWLINRRGTAAAPSASSDEITLESL